MGHPETASLLDGNTVSGQENIRFVIADY